MFNEAREARSQQDKINKRLSNELDSLKPLCAEGPYPNFTHSVLQPLRVGYEKIANKVILIMIIL